MLMLPRLIPVLLLRNRGFVKTVKFKDGSYLGDPMNILKIFNEKEVDEILILDILASREGREPDFAYLSAIARECFMPLGYGGGIQTVKQAETILASGFEKVSFNLAAVKTPDLIAEAAKAFGSQSVVVSIDAKRNLLGGYSVRIRGGTEKAALDPVSLARQAEAMGAGEILINSIDRDGTMAGYDVALIREITAAVRVPVIACGGAGTLNHLVEGVTDGGASAAAAGSFFVFRGPHRAVLINAPRYEEREKCFRGLT